MLDDALLWFGAEAAGSRPGAAADGDAVETRGRLFVVAAIAAVVLWSRRALS